MRSARNKKAYLEGMDSEAHSSSIWKVGLVAISSAIVGGFAAAWWHRKTLAKLQNPILLADIPKTGFPDVTENETKGPKSSFPD